MTDAIQRGSVVLCRGRYGVVWQDGPAELVVLPLMRDGTQRMAHDVELAFADLLSGGIALPGAFVRAGGPIAVPAEGQAKVGALQGAVLCQVVLAVARAGAAAVTEARWGHADRHRAEARSIGCVKL